jgi:hypothetical protein
MRESRDWSCSYFEKYFRWCFYSFDGKTRSDEELAKCLESLIQRLAFLSASTQLRNLQNCILEGLNEETKEAILKRKIEILESRAGERTAYVQTSQ